jgi:hypothetical protein
LPSFCADDAAEQEARRNITFSCNIPGLNVPLQFERTEDDIDKIALTFAAIDHGRLLCKQLKSQQGVQEMVIDHALLAAFRITIGLTSTVCHEFGHAVCRYYDPYATLIAIHLGWSPANILLGSFNGGATEHKAFIDAEKEDDDDQPLAIQYRNLISSWSRWSNVHRNSMISCVTGPLMGALSAYMIYKRAERGYPSLSYDDIAFRSIGWQLTNLLPLNYATDFIQRRLIATIDNEQTKQELEQSFVKNKISEDLADGDKFYDAWNKRKKAQVKINKLSVLYQLAKEQNL